MAGVSPLRALAMVMSCEPGQADFATPEALAGSLRLQGTILCFDGLSGADWTQWAEFLQRFAHACRAHSAGDCGQVVITVDGVISTGRVGDDPGLQVVRWERRLSRLDALIQVGQVMPYQGRSSLERDLRIAIAMELAGYDLAFAARLTAAPLGELLEAKVLLEKEAGRRGWSGQPGKEAWAAGRVDEYDGQRFEHGASLAARGDTDGLRKRLWQAQLKVVFPALEERRLDIVHRFSKSLRPMETRFGYVDRIEDLEISHILEQVRRYRLGPEYVSKLAHMNELRKALAHLDPVRALDLVGAGLVDRSCLIGREQAA